MFGKQTWRLALPVPWLITLVVGLVVLALLIRLYGRGPEVLFSWLVGWLLVSRIVNWVISRRRPKRDSSLP